MRSKKAELEMQESLIVLFVFIVIFLIGFVFFFRYTEQSILNENERFRTENNKIMSVIFANQAEISCSVRDQKSVACADKLKMLSFSELNKELGNRVIRIETAYPEPAKKILCGVNNIQECNVWMLYDGAGALKESMTPLIMTTPISIYDSISGSYEVGVLTLEDYKYE